MAQAEHAHTTEAEDAKKRSNVETLGLQEDDYFNGGKPYYSGTQHFASNIAMFVFCMLGLVATFWALGTYPDGGWVWFVVGILCYAVTFMIPTLILPSKTTHADTDGVTPLMK